MSIDYIPYVDLAAQWSEERDELLPLIEKTLASGQYVGGQDVEELEAEMSEYFNVKDVVGVNSGTDALILSLKALEIQSGDEVITPPNSFVASTAVIENVGAKPVFVDVGNDQNINPELIEASITANTKAIMPVHLTGRMCEMDRVCEIARKYNLYVIEDSAQAAGSRYMDRQSGTWGDVGCFSAHPLKNLNACGDAGYVTTNNEEIATKIRMLRNHGLAGRERVEQFGFVSRMDSIQATILRFRLGRLPSIIERRRRNAHLYKSLLNSDQIYHAPEQSAEYHTFFTFVIQAVSRDQLKRYLADRNIGSTIHYPTPIHFQPASRSFGYSVNSCPVAEAQANTILTLPIHQNLSKEQIIRVATTVNEFFDC